MPKITMIGAGSIVFAQNLIKDILNFKELHGSTICLMDIDEERLQLITGLAEKISYKLGANAIIEPTMKLKDAINNSNYVITMFQQGGLDAYELDMEIPLKYGINQAVGDTLGPGGVFRGIRTIPVLMDICKYMEEMCPDALLINYVNPMVINCWAVNKATKIKSVGLCHSVQKTSRLLADFIEKPYEEVSYKVAGINHMAWFLDFKWNGRDAYPLLWEAIKRPEIYNQEMVRIEIMKHFGAFVTESSYHMSEYIPYMRKRENIVARINQIDSWLTPSGGSYLNHCKKRFDNFYDYIKRQISGEEDIDLTMTHEYGSYIIHSMETGFERRINGNVLNNGVITNLPYDCVVEVPCMVDKNGVQACYVGELPPQLAALNKTNLNVQELAVTGGLCGDRESVIHAVMLDPYTSSVLTMDEIRKMVNEMFEAEKKYLPQFK